MKISVFGLGYVGTVSCGCLAKEGHEIIGVDISKVKVDLINSGQTPIIEENIEDIIKESVSSGRLKAIQEVEEAVVTSDISLICVGTPSKSNGSIDLANIEMVCSQIGKALKKKNEYHAVVIRSTVLPGSTKSVIIPILEKSSCKKIDVDFGICYNPEFLREGSSVYDFYNPPKTVIGTMDKRCADVMKELYNFLPGEIITTSVEVSEMVKYADNTFHATKITFANEIGMICKQLNIDSHEVMDIFCKDTKLNISSHYLTPGFAFGGSCLPKDIRALSYKAKLTDIETPLLNSLLESNSLQIRFVIKRILELGKKKVGFLGFSFKDGTDDLRESPIIEVIETLLGKGYTIKLYDKNVNISKLVGSNKHYIETHIPHIAELMCDEIDDVLHNSDVIVIGNKSDEFKNTINSITKEKVIIDLVRIDRSKKSKGNYFGIAW